jgi:hypothetical protein
MNVTWVKEFLPVSARSSNDESAAGYLQDLGAALNVTVKVNSLIGVGALLNVQVLWSLNGTDWATPDPADSFAPISLAGIYLKRFTIKAPFVKVAYTLVGTINFGVHGWIGP